MRPNGASGARQPKGRRGQPLAAAEAAVLCRDVGFASAPGWHGRYSGGNPWRIRLIVSRVFVMLMSPNDSFSWSWLLMVMNPKNSYSWSWFWMVMVMNSPTIQPIDDCWWKIRAAVKTCKKHVKTRMTGEGKHVNIPCREHGDDPVTWGLLMLLWLYYSNTPPKNPMGKWSRSMDGQPGERRVNVKTLD